MDTTKTKPDKAAQNGAKLDKSLHDGIVPEIVTVILTDDDLFRFGVMKLIENHPYMKDAPLEPIDKQSSPKSGGEVIQYQMVKKTGGA